MKKIGLGFLIALSFFITGQAPAASQFAISQDGGAITIELGFGITLNRDSSLRREWITIGDSLFPVGLDGGTGIKTIYETGKGFTTGDYRYKADFTVSVREPISAIEIRFLVFNIWGEHVRTLSSTQVSDFVADKTYTLSAKWRLWSENEASEHYASIAYIAQVRLASGKVIRPDPQFILEQARRFSAKFSENDLEPSEELKNQK